MTQGGVIPRLGSGATACLLDRGRHGNPGAAGALQQAKGRVAVKIVLYLFAVGSGLMNAVQSGCNSTLGKSIGQFPAAVVIGLIATGSAVAFGLVAGGLAWPAADKVAGAPWWAWVGGVLGATFIMAQLFVAGEVGSGVFIAMTVTASVTMSLVLDHYGLVGFEVHPAGWGRIAGALFMFAGLGLIARY